MQDPLFLPVTAGLEGASAGEAPNQGSCGTPLLEVNVLLLGRGRQEPQWGLCSALGESAASVVILFVLGSH